MEYTGMKQIFAGISKDCDDWQVWQSEAGDDLCVVIRNQSDHDRRFFVVGVKKTEKALELAKKHCVA